MEAPQPEEQDELADVATPIPAEELEHIFDPFYRAANADGIPGHGIGLALAHTLLQRNGAQLTVTSSSENTIFTIRFSK